MKERFLDRYFLPIISLVALFLFWKQLSAWHDPVAGWFSFLLYFFAVGEWWLCVLRAVTGIRRSWVSRLLAWGMAFVVLGFFFAIPVVWYRITPLIIWIVCAVFALLSFCAFLSLRSAHVREYRDEGERGFFEAPVFSKRLIFPVLYLALFFVAAYLLATSRSGDALLSPWQTIRPAFLPVMFLLTVILGVIALSHFGTKTVLFFLILHALLLHSYLPASHALPWGGDVWRHIASEVRLARGDAIVPVLFGAGVTTRDIYGISIPDALAVPHKYAYGHLWGTSAALSQTLALDLLALNKWMGPIAWSLFVPALLYHIAIVLFRSRKAALFSAWLSSIPFPLQAAGALTLPVSFDLIAFLYALWLVVLWADTGAARARYGAMAITAMFAFGYSLYFILLAFLLLSVAVMRNVKGAGHAVIALCAIAGVLLIPAIELFAGMSAFPAAFEWLSAAKRFIAEWSGWHYAGAIRPHDIASGNILVNHAPSGAFVANAFTAWRWWALPALSLFWLCAACGAYRAVRSGRRSWHAVVVLFSAAMGGYVVTWYALAGEHLFARRLDPLIAVLSILLVSYALAHIPRAPLSSRRMRAIAFSLVAAFAWLGAASYASGPDSRVASVSEYEAARATWRDLESAGPPCVLADTWTLLALEAVSAGAVVGGGFPINADFSQPDRERLFRAMSDAPSTSTIESAFAITGSRVCRFIDRSGQTSVFSSSGLQLPK